MSYMGILLYIGSPLLHMTLTMGSFPGRKKVTLITLITLIALYNNPNNPNSGGLSSVRAATEV